MSGRSPLLDEALVKWRRQFPEITEQEALADLYCKGYACNETYAAANKRELECLNAENGVIDHPDQLTGYHLAWVEKYKEGVLKFFASRASGNGYEFTNGFIGVDVLRVAIETHVINKPNGYSIA